MTQTNNQISARWLCGTDIKFSVREYLGERSNEYGGMISQYSIEWENNGKIIVRTLDIPSNHARDLILKSSSPNTVYQLVQKTFLDSKGVNRTYFDLVDVTPTASDSVSSVAVDDILF